MCKASTSLTTRPCLEWQTALKTSSFLLIYTCWAIRKQESSQVKLALNLDRTLSAAYFEEAAKRGSNVAKYNLAVLYQKSDPERAFQLMLE